MKILRAEATTVHMPLEEPYSIAYDFASSATNILLTLETEGKEVGYGIAAPEKLITGETPEECLKVLRDTFIPAVTGMEITQYERILHKLRTELPLNPSAFAALDMALLDLLGKKADLPVYKLLGGYRDRIRTSITIGILPERETILKVRDWIGKGFFSIKLKGGQDWESDAARVMKVREAVSPFIELRFDANAGYSLEAATKFFSATHDANLVFVEQPLEKMDYRGMEWLTNHFKVPVMADESLHSLDNAVSLLHRDAPSVRLFNVKLMKVGGILEALPIIRYGGKHSVGSMIGCMDEMAAGIAAGLHLALSSPSVQFGDLDGHIGLVGDPTEGSVVLREGTLFPNPEPGLGIHFKGVL